MKISHNNTYETIIISTDLTSFGQQKLEFCLVAKVFSSKMVNRETFKVHMPRILQAKKNVKIEVIGENIFLFDFTSLADRRQALSGGPWTFFKELVDLQALSGIQQAANLVFKEILIWVQCHNIPLALMFSAILGNIGEQIGRVIEVDTKEDGSCSWKFGRIRVSLDIPKPLSRVFG